ncbi:MAG TPA: SMP-30/gluconolactonase/LRE family protein [Xanthomonadaceae bacterium]|nr:SMP-30/gluconolactonase/LRE family protein [Xanthomonadaceae bacterium]
MRTLLTCILLALLGLVAYLLAWPVPVDPQAWQPPVDRGHADEHALNHRLARLELLDIAGTQGPEAVAVDADGRLYAATEHGHIVRLQADGGGAERWADTGGRPLGMAFADDGTLLVADAVLGLLAVTTDGSLRVLADSADGIAFGLADDVDVAADGRVYFTDASHRFPWKRFGEDAARFAILEHGGDGRVLEYDPASGDTSVLVDGLQFANGIAVGHDQTYLLVTETARYRVLKVWLSGARRGQFEVLIDNLPGFPDNITRGADGRYWLALFSPRLPLLDRLAGYPFLRKIVVRIPRFLQPQPNAHGHVMALDSRGRVLADLQDPTGAYPMTTSALEFDGMLYVGSLVAPALARLSLDGIIDQR